MTQTPDAKVTSAEAARRARAKKAEREIAARKALAEILAVSTDERVRRIALVGLGQAHDGVASVPHTYDRLRQDVAVTPRTASQSHT